MVTVKLTTEQASRLVTYLIMVEKLSGEERDAWAKIAREKAADGAVKYPNAADNASFWDETIAMMKDVRAVVDAAPFSD